MEHPIECPGDKLRLGAGGDGGIVITQPTKNNRVIVIPSAADNMARMGSLDLSSLDLSLNDGQDDSRWVFLRMVNRIVSDSPDSLIVVILPGIEVSIEAREVAA
jgi:hypothetical protein